MLAREATARPGPTPPVSSVGCRHISYDAPAAVKVRYG
jgi:hypothetical protein